MTDPMTTPNRDFEPAVDDTTECPRCGAYGLYTALQRRQMIEEPWEESLWERAALGDLEARSRLRERLAPDSRLLTEQDDLRLVHADVWCPACGEAINRSELDL